MPHPRPSLPGLPAAVLLLILLATGCGNGGSEADGPPREEPGPGAAPEPPPAASAELSGLYVYLADAPSFSPCGTDAVIPVWQDSASLRLERRYLAERREPGAPMRVRLRGRVEERVAMEGGPRPHLLVDSVIELHGDGVCPGTRVAAPLVGTDWRVVGTPAPEPRVEEGGAWLVLSDDPERLDGHTGCRPVSGRYTWVGTRLRVHALSASPADCPGDALHRRVLEGLAATGSYRVLGDTLELLGESGPVLTLAARR